MVFGWINVIAGLIAAVMAGANVLYLREGHLAGDFSPDPVWLRLTHFFAAAACVLMVVPVGKGRFLFAAPWELYVYMTVDLVCLIIYVLVFMKGIRVSLTKRQGTMLILIAFTVFLVSSLTLRHYYLTLAGALFLLCGFLTNRRRKKA